MASLLIVYGTTDGHTSIIAERMAAMVRRFGHRVRVESADAHPSMTRADDYEGVMVMGSLHAGKHQRAVGEWVKANAAALAHIPGAFFSVSLSAASRNPKTLAGAQRCADTFLEQTGWTPSMVRLVAGALLYTRYGWLKRWMMRRIARAEGGDTDTTRDFEYTDWTALANDVEDFLASAVPAPEPAIRAPELASIG